MNRDAMKEAFALWLEGKRRLPACVVKRELDEFAQEPDWYLTRSISGFHSVRVATVNAPSVRVSGAFDPVVDVPNTAKGKVWVKIHRYASVTLEELREGAWLDPGHDVECAMEADDYGNNVRGYLHAGHVTPHQAVGHVLRALHEVSWDVKPEDFVGFVASLVEHWSS
jgi:hypothetical protein